MKRPQVLFWPMVAMCLLVAACARNDQATGRDQTDAFCFNERNNTAAHTKTGSCANGERRITEHEYAVFKGLGVVPGSGAQIPPGAAYCFDVDDAEAYMRDFGGCHWDDYAITESEYVTTLYTHEQPASIEAREARWTYCYDPSIDFVYAQQEKACSPDDDSIDRAEYVERIRSKHAS